MSTDQKRCFICGNILRHTASRFDKYDYYGCPECGLVTSLPLPDTTEIMRFYDGFLFGKPKSEEHNVKLSYVLEDTKKILRDIHKFVGISSPFSVLDWGGGVGYYSNAFSMLGCKTTLIDIDRQACDYAVEKFGDSINVICHDPLSYVFNAKYDLVFCNQVIEHYADPRKMLSKIKEVLSPGGLAIITTPNQECKEYFFRRSWLRKYLKMVAKSRSSVPATLMRFIRKPWLCCDPPRHIHAFNRKSLSTLLESECFKPVAVFGEYYNTQYYSLGNRRDFWQIRRARSLLRIASGLPDYLGIEFLSMIARKGQWGNNLVAYALLL